MHSLTTASFVLDLRSSTFCLAALHGLFMNLHLTRIFFHVAQHRSFSRGAESLSISQSAASKGVRELEQQLDVPLIERGAGLGKRSRGLQLTDGGQALFEHARGIFALERAAADDLRARAELRRGELTLGASTTVAAYWLPFYVARFAREHPAIQLHVAVGNTHTIVQGLADCRMDLALVEGGVDDPDIAARYWRDEQLVVIGPEHYPLASRRPLKPAMLNDEIWLVREPGSGTREVTQQLLKQNGLEPAHQIEIGSNEGIARAVAGGLGIAMLPWVVVQDLVALGRVQTLELAGAATLRRPLFRLERAERPLSPAAQAFSALLDQVGEAPAVDAIR